MHKIHNPNNPNNPNNQNGGGTPRNVSKSEQYSKTKINPNKRQTYTYSDSLQSMDKIQEQLKGYERVEDIDTIEIGTPVRYITWKYGKMRFCVGGLLIAKLPTYCKLTNYKKDIQWNVKKEHQTNPQDKKDVFKTIFYKRCFNTSNQEGGDANDGDNKNENEELSGIMQTTDISNFYKKLEKKEKREKWLRNNIYNTKYKQGFF
jgi:hypothetical protein